MRGKMDIDFRLAELIHKYGIDELFPDFYQSYLATGIAKRLYMQLGSTVLVGTRLIDIEWFRRNICGEDVKTLLLERDNISSELQNQKKQGITFLVISYYGREEAMVQLLESGCCAICLYEVFEKNHIFFRGDFYDVYNGEYVRSESNELSRYSNFDINRVFFYHRRRYELETDPDNKKTTLKKLIFDCAYAKDFLTLKKYIDILGAQTDGEEKKKYFLFYQEVEDLLSEIKKQLHNRNKRDCIMIWLDALEYGEDADMPFLSAKDDNTIVFSDVYTVTPYTRATLKTLFAKSRIVEEESYKMKVGTENSPLFRGLRQRNYQFRYYGCYVDAMEQEYAADHFYNRSDSFTQIYWDVIGDILKDDTDSSFFCVLHEIAQTHFPFISMGISGEQYYSRTFAPGYQPDKRIIDGQALDSRKYVDRQLKFWGGLLPDEMFKIYMSDHGHTVLGKYHCILKVQQESLKARVCHALISWYDFDELIYGILDNGFVNDAEIQNDFCVVQDAPFYYKDHILAFLRRKELPETLLAYQGVVTKEDLFLRHDNGMELYQKHCNDERMVTDERLDYLRGITSTKCIDIASEEKFRYSYLAHQVIQRCEVRSRERWERMLNIIRTAFKNIGEDEVFALRGGGYHSLRLLMLLEEKLRKKVSCVIDTDRACFAGKLGIKVITMQEASERHLDKVLISSFNYHNVWKEECQQNLQAEVIDLYDLFKQQDICCRTDFYKLECADEDLEGIAL